MQETKLLKNLTAVKQSWGSWEIGPGGIGAVPAEVAESLRRQPSPEFVVIEDEPRYQPFVETPHRPFSPRYRK